MPVPISFPASGNPEGHFVVGDGHDAALRILNFDGEHGHVFAVGGEFLAIGVHHQLRRGAGGFALRRHDDLAAFETARLDGAGSVLHVPGQCESFFMSFAPRLLPLQKSSTLSRLEYTQTAISLPSIPGQFQCGKRCRTGLAVHHDW